MEPAAANKGAPLLGWQVGGAAHKQRSGFHSSSPSLSRPGRRLLSLFPSDSARDGRENQLLLLFASQPTSQPVSQWTIANWQLPPSPPRAGLQFERARWRHLSLATAEGTFLAPRASDVAARPSGWLTLRPPLGA